MIRKQVEACGRIFIELDVAIGKPIVEPMRGDPQAPGELGDSQRPSHLSWVRLMPLL